MSDATDRLRTFLTISPSVVFPDEALELFESVETEVTRLSDENAKLRELAGLLLYGMCHDAPPHEVLLWSQKVNRLTDELGIEVDG